MTSTTSGRPRDCDPHIDDGGTAPSQPRCRPRSIGKQLPRVLSLSESTEWDHHDRGEEQSLHAADWGFDREDDELRQLEGGMLDQLRDISNTGQANRRSRFGGVVGTQVDTAFRPLSSKEGRLPMGKPKHQKPSHSSVEGFRTVSNRTWPARCTSSAEATPPARTSQRRARAPGESGSARPSETSREIAGRLR